MTEKAQFLPARSIVTKEEFLAAIWPGVYVSEKGPRVCIREIRQALEDDAAAPQFIETVQGRGYRFIATVTANSQPVSSSKLQVPSQNFEPAPSFPPQATSIVGREVEIGRLQKGLEKALRGERQLIFVTGEPGIGKTTVVEAFLDRLAAAGSLWTGRGQCVEHYGAGEPYLPILDALERLCRTAGDEVVYGVLERYVPTWLVHLPWLLSEIHQNSFQRQEKEATRERMLREMAVALEALTIKTPSQSGRPAVERLFHLGPVVISGAATRTGATPSDRHVSSARRTGKQASVEDDCPGAATSSTV